MTQANLQHNSTQNIRQVKSSNLILTLFQFLSDEEWVIVDEKVRQFREIIYDSKAEINSILLSTFSEEERNSFLTHLSIVYLIDDLAKALSDTQLHATQREFLEKELKFLKAIDKKMQKDLHRHKNLSRIEELKWKLQEQVSVKYEKEIKELKKEIREFYILRFRKNLKSIAIRIRVGTFVTDHVDEVFLNLLKKYAFTDNINEQETLLLEMEKRLNELPIFV